MTSNDNADSYSSNAGELSTSITSVPSMRHAGQLVNCFV